MHCRLASSVLSGITTAGNANGSPGDYPSGLNGSDGVYVTQNNDVYVAEFNAHRVRRFQSGSSVGDVVAGIGTPGSAPTQLYSPSSIFFDEITQGLFVGDMGNGRIQFFPRNSTVGITVAGANGELGFTLGVRLDNKRNIYASDASYFRVMRWPLNSTSNGTTVAGGTQGSGTWSFDNPRQIDFDATYSFLYVVDKANHRIQMYNLVNTSATPITVAGGNGPGAAPNQLNQPNSACVSRKTGALYIADAGNNRVQRWDRGSSVGVTVAGSATGVWGNSPTLMATPSGVALDANETFLYVSEYSNNRVQRFPLI